MRHDRGIHDIDCCVMVMEKGAWVCWTCGFDGGGEEDEYHSSCEDG